MITIKLTDISEMTKEIKKQHNEKGTYLGQNINGHNVFIDIWHTYENGKVNASIVIKKGPNPFTSNVVHSVHGTNYASLEHVACECLSFSGVC